MKRSHEAVDYSEGMPESHCGICKHYQSPGACGLVESPIDPGYWCRLFARFTHDSEARMVVDRLARRFERQYAPRRGK